MAVVVCDLDGVVWRGAEAIPGSSEAIAELRSAGLSVAFLTNNSSATIGEYVRRLDALGVEAHTDEILTSAVAAGELVAASHPAGTRVLVCGGPGVTEALERHGLDPVRDGPAEVVIVGWHRTFDFDRLTVAARSIRAGAEFLATNLDPTFPSPDGFLPGNGSLVAAVATASGATPTVAGKPEEPTARLVHDRFGDRGVMIGDRPSTDGKMATVLGWPFGLVLTGVGGPDGEEPIPDPPPTLVGDDLRAIAPRVVELLA